MYRHLSRQATFRGPLVRAGRRGFTLVELLVVITIIAMLVGLLIPAVLMARNTARTTQCLNNQRNLTQAVLQYNTSKMKFPPLFSVQPLSLPSGTLPPQRVGWVPHILPYIEQTPLYNTFQMNAWSTVENANVEMLVCPARNPGVTSAAPLSYVVNAGMSDFVRSSATPFAIDYQENGLFFDEYAPHVNANIMKPPTMDLTYISSHDGTKNTLLLSENLDATVDWIQTGQTMPGWPMSPTVTTPIPATTPAYVPPQPRGDSRTTYNAQQYKYTPGYKSYSWWQGIVWYVQQSPTPAPTWGTIPNPSQFSQDVTSTPTDLDIGYAHPSSNHSGGFNAAFCDGSVRLSQR